MSDLFNINRFIFLQFLIKSLFNKPHPDIYKDYNEVASILMF